MAKNKKRLDILLASLGFFESSQQAQPAIMAGLVKINNHRTKPGDLFDEEEFFEAVEADPNYLNVEVLSPYVSRGAYKLKAAHEAWGLDFTDKMVLDIGASTGGFTDYALQNGAARVIALDVGKGQLHYKLRQDPRVINLEGVNFRELESLSSLRAVENGVAIQSLDLIVIDVSFISLITILNKLKSLLNGLPRRFAPRNDEPTIIALIKPQFEASKEIMDKCQGVIKDELIRKEVLDRVLKRIEELGYVSDGLIESPIKGAKGNKEYLINFSKFY